jgi:integrase
MSSDRFSTQFQSTLAPLMEKFLQEKRGCGYRYDEETRILRRLDRFLFQEELTGRGLPRFLAKRWLAKRAHERPRTHQQRITVVRQFAKFLIRLGYPAYVPDSALSGRHQASFVPRILTHEEIRKLLQAADKLVPTARSPLRHLIMPEVFRLLYGCGFRLGEVLNLRVRDVDLDRGIVTVRQGKFRKDRLVPLAPSLVNRLRRYASGLDDTSPDAMFFPTPDGGPFSLRTVCGISHGGRGKGPRVHDLRHAFAVHTLVRWYRNGEDLDAKLPLLATYLGHQHLSGTQRYLHLTADLFPEITLRVDAAFGEVIPGRIEP